MVAKRKQIEADGITISIVNYKSDDYYEFNRYGKS